MNFKRNQKLVFVFGFVVLLTSTSEAKMRSYNGSPNAGTPFQDMLNRGGQILSRDWYGITIKYGNKICGAPTMVKVDRPSVSQLGRRFVCWSGKEIGQNEMFNSISQWVKDSYNSADIEGCVVESWQVLEGTTAQSTAAAIIPVCSKY